MHYRSEIDGLRALAIIPVILFHAGTEFCSGGFLGVDIFFVISGYLITGIIVKETQENKLSDLKYTVGLSSIALHLQLTLMNANDRVSVAFGFHHSL